MSKKSRHKKFKTTPISKHKIEGRVLKPPFRQLGNIVNSSWKDERLPEMLWAVLLIGNLPREKALAIFRQVSNFVMVNPDLSDVTISGISLWPLDKRIKLIELLKWSHPNALPILQSLVIFPALPGHKEWSEVLGNPASEEVAANYLSQGVKTTLWHQSTEATDCRWIKFLCEMHSGKLQFSSSIGGIEETLRGVDEYPNYGDLDHVRAFIRSSEIGMQLRDASLTTNWPEKFWSACLGSTLCAPMPRKQTRKDAISIDHGHLNRIRHLLYLHYLKTDKTTNIDGRHDTIFGLGFYSLRLLVELVATNLSRGVIGRLALRSLVECYITLSFLLKKDEPGLWADFRNYGIGQMKLSYLKSRESKEKPSFIDQDYLEQITNEDRWEEFSDIKIGQWDNLRSMSSDAGCKEIYDAYYDWTSTFSHGNWGAIRESSFELCANPLHRLHLIPSVTVHPLPGVLEDAVKIGNLILNLLEESYPGLNCQIVDNPKPKKLSWYKKAYYSVRYRKAQKLFDYITKGE